MNREQKKAKRVRARAHGPQQRRRAAEALTLAEKKAKSQKKGPAQVAALMKRAGYWFDGRRWRASPKEES